MTSVTEPPLSSTTSFFQSSSSTIFTGITTPASSQASSSPIATSTKNAVSVHTVYVGNGGHRFAPNITYANPGDIVSFLFYPTNHSIVRGAYGFPCVPYEYTYPDKTGFYSGHFLTTGIDSAVSSLRRSHAGMY
jgi:hypothetical protein